MLLFPSFVAALAPVSHTALAADFPWGKHSQMWVSRETFHCFFCFTLLSFTFFYFVIKKITDTIKGMPKLMHCSWQPRKLNWALLFFFPFTYAAVKSRAQYPTTAYKDMMEQPTAIRRCTALLVPFLMCTLLLYEGVLHSLYLWSVRISKGIGSAVHLRIARVYALAKVQGAQYTSIGVYALAKVQGVQYTSV